MSRGLKNSDTNRHGRIHTGIGYFEFSAPSLTSRYLKAVHRLPLYHGDGAQWVAALQDLQDKEKFDLVIPCDDRSILCFDAHRGEFSDLKIAIPSREGIDAFYDKKQTRDIASESGVAVARGRLLAAQDTVEGLLEEFGLPMVIKPRRSYVLQSLHSRGKVHIVTSEPELRSVIGGLRDRSEFLVEETFPGVGGGVSILASEGEILSAFEHRRVHEPRKGGGSSLRESYPLHKGRLEACAKLVQATKYTGVAMFEFRIDPETDNWILIEVNARFWGSLPLPVALGVDFPSDLYRLLTRNERPSRTDYTTGKRGRNLLADLYSILEGMSGPDSASRKFFDLASFALQPLLWLTRQERSDTFVIDDLRPAFREVEQLFSERFARGKRDRDRDQARCTAISSLSGLREGASVTVLCQGNICRSPFAAHLLSASKLSQDLSFQSSGLIPLPGRPSPDNAISASKAFDIDLSDHKSHFFDEAACAETDAIILFDERTYADLHSRFPGHGKPVIFMGVFGSGNREIHDPYGGALEQFEQTYRAISEAVETLSDSYSEGQTP